MHYDDALYGKVTVTEPVLSDLIASEALQRTKGVSQHGITALLGITPPFSRFEHCVGTMLLVRRLGAPVKEQIAALLHDISHTAFSHVIDYVFDDHENQSYHEAKKEEIVAGSDVPAILSRHKMDWRELIDEDKFPLLEQPAPALCADRLDYFLRDLEFLNLARIGEISAAAASLEVFEEQIVVNSLNMARWLAYTYIETDRASWSNLRDVGLYQITAEAIKTAIQFEIIKESDLWDSDESLWCKLQSVDHPEVKRWVKLVSPGTRFSLNHAQPTFTVSTKVRSIDPLVREGKTIFLLSELDPTFSHYRSEYLASKQGCWPIEVIASPGTMG